jgi:hypothetical protein
MMSRRLLLLLLCSSLAACELVADFDRGKLTPAVVDSGVSAPDLGDDAGEDAGTQKGAD